MPDELAAGVPPIGAFAGFGQAQRSHVLTCAGTGSIAASDSASSVGTSPFKTACIRA
jgi:hypothetical protein